MNPPSNEETTHKPTQGQYLTFAQRTRLIFVVLMTLSLAIGFCVPILGLPVLIILTIPSHVLGLETAGSIMMVMPDTFAGWIWGMLLLSVVVLIISGFIGLIAQSIADAKQQDAQRAYLKNNKWKP